MPVPKQVVDEMIAALPAFDGFGTRKERNHLHEVLKPGEKLLGLTSGFNDGNTWLITITDQRILLLDKGMLWGLKQIELPISHIKSISHKTGLIFGEIKISTGGDTKKIEQIKKADVPKIARIISDLLENKHHTAASYQTTVTEDDVVAKLERLAALKEKGILTDAEFAEQKAKILA